MDEQNQEQVDLAEEPTRWSIGRILGILLVVVAGVTALYLVVGYLAWQSGQRLRVEREQELRGQ